MVSISQMGRQGSNTAMAQVEVQMEAATRRTNLTRIFFKDIFQGYFSRIFFKNIFQEYFSRIFFKNIFHRYSSRIFFKNTNRNIFQRHQENKSDQNICQERTEDLFMTRTLLLEDNLYQLYIIHSCTFT